MANNRIHPKKPEVMEAIQQHLATVGSNNWNVIIDRFRGEDLHEQTIWRWIREAKSADVPRPQLINAKAKIIQQVKKAGGTDRQREARENGTEPIAKHLPAAPSPDYIARTGEAGLQNIDFVAEIRKLYSDAQMLRAYGITEREAEDGTKTEVIKNPVMFDKSIARRASLLETAIRAVQEIWDLRQMQQFYAIVVEEIGRADPETQKRIMDRLAELNSRAGLTMAFKV